MRVLASIGLALAMLDIASASPTKQITQLQCLAVELVVDALQAYSSATPFCSSYLSIPTITSTVTATSSLTTTSIVTQTTGTDTITASLVTVTETASSTITTCILSAVDKRGAQPTKKSSSTTSSATGLPSCVAAFPSAQVSSACSCLSIPTPSTTVTNFVTVTPVYTSYFDTAALATVTPTSTLTITSTSTDIVCPTPTQCGNQGFQWAEYDNDQGDNDDKTYSQFDPEVYKTESPNQTGVTSTAGGIDADGGEEITVYDSTSFYSDNFVLDHRGYLYAVVEGTYTFSISNVDDSLFIWVGDEAYAGWTRDNANIDVTINTSKSGTFTVDLTEGEYLPVRVMFVQAQGAASFDLSIAAPDGTVFLDSSTDNSPYLIQYSCDGVTAPAYLAWGSEL